MGLTSRAALLLRLIKILFGVAVCGLLVVLADYAVDFRPKNIQATYHFPLQRHNIGYDRPVWLKQDNLHILVIKRSVNLMNQLSQSSRNLQDSDSDSSRQPAYAKNVLRSRDGIYFVSYAIGTDFSCPLELKDSQTLKETCGTASYDFAGRALSGKNQFQNLTVPDYNFNDDFSVLSIFID